MGRSNEHGCDRLTVRGVDDSGATRLWPPIVGGVLLALVLGVGTGLVLVKVGEFKG